MLPKYGKFKDDLTALKAKLAEVREEFRSSLSGGWKGNEYREIYESAVRSFDILDANFAILDNAESTPEQLDAAWDAIKEAIPNADLRMPMPNENNEAIGAELDAALAKDDFRRLWRTTKKMKELSFETDYMNSQSRFAEFNAGLEAFDAEKRGYLTELYSFDGKLNYNSYYDMLAKEEQFRKAAAENEKNYNDLKNSGEVERLQSAYHDLKLDSIMQIANLDRQIADHSKKVDALSADLSALDAEIGDTVAHESEIAQKVHENAEVISKKYEEQNVLSSEETQISLRSAKYQETIDQLRESLNGYEEFLSDREKQTVTSKMTKNEKAAVEKSKEYVGLLRKEDSLNDLKDRFDRYLAENGLKDLSPAEFEEKLKNGETYVTKLSPKLLQSYRDQKVRSVTEAADLYEKFTGFKNELAEIYGVEDAGILDSIDKNIRTPGEYLRTWNKAYRNIGAEREKIRSEAAKNPDMNHDITMIQDAYDHIPLAKGNIEEIEKLDALEMKRKDAIFARRYELDEEIRKLEAKAKEETFDARLAGLYARRKTLLTEKEEVFNQGEYLSQERTTIRNKELEAFDKVETAERRLAGYKSAYEQNKANYEKTHADCDKFERLYQKHLDLKRSSDAIREKTAAMRPDAFNRNSALYHIKLSVSSGLYGFRSTFENGRKKGHVNHEEFERMKNAVNAFVNADSGLAPTLSASTYKYHLDRIRAAAQEYITAKKTEIRPIPSSMRKYRLDLANRLVAFAEAASKRMDESDKTLKETNEHLAASGFSEGPMSAERDDVFRLINQGVEKKEQFLKNRQNVNQKQNAADKDLQVGGKQPSLK